MQGKQPIRILVAAGGTGGHVYPALAIAEAAIQRQPAVHLSFVGSVDGFERPMVQAGGIAFDTYDEVLSGPVHGVSLPRKVLSAVQLALGTLQSLGLMWRRKPDVVLLTGGWVGLPVALAAWLWRVPSLVYLPDIEPGLTIRVVRRFARLVALTVPESAAYFPQNRTETIGYPLRGQMLAATRAAGQAHFKLDPARRTLLVFGGSRGARAINTALLDILPALFAAGVQVIHVTGTLDWPDIEAKRDALPDTTHYHVFPYLHQEMGLAMAAADLVVSRSGASVLGEFPHFGLPAVLIPYPHAWRYQKVNADYLADRGAAVCLPEAEMTAGLLPLVRDLLGNAARLQPMQAAAAALAHPQAAQAGAAALIKLAEAR
jgi:UDP-N-acetylglucosamine--N-acetylmuramyl-(pentapeptide) pyrophosphoryl-undecaprenol N-acetylglucosamine transferase